MSGFVSSQYFGAEADIDGFVFDENAVFYQALKVFLPKTTEDAPLSMDFDGYKYEASCNDEYAIMKEINSLL